MEDVPIVFHMDAFGQAVVVRKTIHLDFYNPGEHRYVLVSLVPPAQPSHGPCLHIYGLGHIVYRNGFDKMLNMFLRDNL